jgi:hypothetical protein
VERIEVYVEGSDGPIGVTPNHPFWCEDVEDFVRADHLVPGVRLRSEDGFPRVLAIASRDSAEAVNMQSAKMIAELMAEPTTRDQIKRALRGGGGMHEWMMVSKAATARKWGVTAEEIMDAVSGTKALDRKLRSLSKGNAIKYGHSGAPGSNFHNKLAELMDKSKSADEYKRRVKAFLKKELGLDNKQLRELLPEWFFQ